MPRPTGTKSKFLSILKKKEISSRSLIKVSNSRPDAWHGHGTLEKSLSKLYPSQKQWSRFVSPTSAAGISVRYKKRCQKSFLLSSQEGKFCRCQFLSGCSSILKPWTVVWRLFERTGTFQFGSFLLEGLDFIDLDWGQVSNDYYFSKNGTGGQKTKSPQIYSRYIGRSAKAKWPTFLPL